MQKDFTNIQIKERNQRKLTSSYVESYLFLIKQGRKEIRKEQRRELISRNNDPKLLKSDERNRYANSRSSKKN